VNSSDILKILGIFCHFFQGVNTEWAKKTGPYLKVCNSCIWWHRKAFSISKCSALYPEQNGYFEWRHI